MAYDTFPACPDELRANIHARVSLNWTLDAQSKGSFFARKLFHQELFAKHPRTVNDDIWTFNTQVSSQWDGLRHFAYQKEKKFYNGVTMEDIHSTDSNGDKTTVNGIQGVTFSRNLSLLSNPLTNTILQPGQRKE
jgi:hypothetical protein